MNNHLRIFFILIFALANGYLFCQTDQNVGFILEDTLYDSVPLSKKYKHSKALIYPSKKSLRDYCPTPKNQGSNGSCVPLTISYAGMTIARAVQNMTIDTQEVNQMANSASFVYNNIITNQNCKEGVPFSSAFEFLKNNGSCLSKDFEEPCDIIPEKALYKEASNYKIESYERLFERKDSSKVYSLCAALSDGVPVVIGINTTKSFYDKKPVWDISKEELLLPSKYNHAILAIGYDENSKMIELMNSYGTGYGDNGFLKISYEDLEKVLLYGFVFTLEENGTKSIQANSKTKNLQLEEISILKLDSFGEFLKLPLTYLSNEKTFKLNHPMQVNDVFQIEVKSNISYIYVFNTSENNKYSNPKNGENYSLENISLPNKNKVFQLTDKGLEKFTLVLSNHDSNDLNNLIKSQKPFSVDELNHSEIIIGVSSNSYDSKDKDKSKNYINSEIDPKSIIPITIEIIVE